MRNISISRLLLLFGFCVTLGLAGSIGLQTFALDTLKIGSPLFENISDGKDIVADILPPPLFVVEAYMLASEGAIHTELAKTNLQKIRVLKASYDDRRRFWTTSALPKALRSKLENGVFLTADVFWRSLDGEYVIAAQASDEHAMHASLDSIKDKFHAHENQVKQFADMANAYLAASVDAAATAGARYQTIAFAGSGFSVSLFLVGLWVLRHRAIKPLGEISRYMSLLAAGDYSREVPLKSRKDEIGIMAKSVDVFRSAAIERQNIRKQMDDDRLAADTQSLERQRIRLQEANELQTVVETLGAGLGRLAECNIRITIDEPFAEKFEPLRRDFNNAIATFQATLEQVLGKTSQLSGNAEEMREAADNLSRRTEQQAAALEETSASLEQVTSTVRSSVDRTSETRALVRDAKECATASATIVHDAVDAMKRIATASDRISQIIDVIDQIAFQTNLLALNAGVEAARAGEAGKGFAVVAQEVRELAQRSATAAKEINSLIKNSSSEVLNGVRLVDQTGAALGRITGFVSEIDTKVDAIATSSREQSVGLQEISSAVNSIDQMTQQNAAMVEETNAISHSLAAGSGELTELVKRFKLNRRAAIREPGATFSRTKAA
jgi:methyl-accepting chemotaxis protein